MPKSKSDDDSFIGAPSSRYSRITQHTKDKLCYIVTTTSLKVKSAAKILKINSSTAKMILKKFYKLPLQEQNKVLERGSKSKKEKSQIQAKQKLTNVASIENKQVLDILNQQNSNRQEVVKKEFHEQQVYAASQENKKEEPMGQNPCLIFCCPLYNFYSF